MEVDYIVVGCGLAGIAFLEQLIAHNKTYVVFDNNSQQSSTIAGGLYNPVTLKRFTPVWENTTQLKIMLPHYLNIEKKLHKKLDYKVPVYRRFTSIEEQNNWFSASDKKDLKHYLSQKVHKNNNPNINATFGFGEVLQTGRIDTKLLIQYYHSFLKSKKVLIQEAFNYNKLKTISNQVLYKTIKAKHIVFAEGFGVKQNPFFNHLPLNGTKGELLTIYAPKLKLDAVLKSSVFIIPLGKDLYKIGATYDFNDKSSTITAKAKTMLVNKLKTIIKCNFEIVNQVAGIRPTVLDRKPLVGQHNNYKNYYILNGLGTRGVMIAPYVAKQLFAFIETKNPLQRIINSNRYEK